MKIYLVQDSQIFQYVCSKTITITSVPAAFVWGSSPFCIYSLAPLGRPIPQICFLQVMCQSSLFTCGHSFEEEQNDPFAVGTSLQQEMSAGVPGDSASYPSPLFLFEDGCTLSRCILVHSLRHAGSAGSESG